MEITVQHKFMRGSERKIRPILYVLKDENARNALIKMKFFSKPVSHKLASLIKSGIAGAEEKGMDGEKLFIKKIKCDQASKFKRRICVSKGRALPIAKRLCHVNITFSDEMTNQIASKKKQIEKNNQKESNGTKN